MPTTGSSLGAPGTENVTRLVVAPWPPRALSAGLQRSRTARSRTASTPASPRSAWSCSTRTARSPARCAAAGTALIVALRPRADELLWLITALDEIGLAAGVEALKPRLLNDAYTVAVTDATVERLPL